MEYKLRKWEMADAPALVRYANNRNVSRMMTDGFPHPYTLAEAEAFIGLVASEGPSTIFAIDVEGEAVGSVGITPQSDIHRMNAEVGYWLAEPFWGRGIVTRVVREICDYAFSQMDVSLLFARPFGSNRASHRVLEKAGFTCEARLAGFIFKDGLFDDELIYIRRR